MTGAACTERQDRAGGRHARPPLFILLVGLVLASGCARDAARVGEFRIAEKDLAQRAKVSEIQFPGSGKPHIALAQLVHGYLALSVLRSLNVPTGDAAIEAEAARIDASTRAPELLKKIKDVYGSDRRAYLDTCVRVVYAERVAYKDAFLKDPAIHAAQKKQADAFLAAARKDPAAFGAIAAKMGLSPETLTLSPDRGIRRADAKGPKPPGRSPAPGAEETAQAARMIAALSGVRPGDAAPTALEWPEGFQAIRLVRREGAAYRIESVSVPKRTFDDWFWAAASKTPVRIEDKELKEAFLKEVSWARRAAIEP